MYFIATLRVRLDEDSLEKAEHLAQELATRICDEAFTDCAAVAEVHPSEETAVKLAASNKDLSFPPFNVRLTRR